MALRVQKILFEAELAELGHSDVALVLLAIEWKIPTAVVEEVAPTSTEKLVSDGVSEAELRNRIAERSKRLTLDADDD